MGDLSVEPSMEDILSSIKRIIAEDGEPAAARGRRGARPIPGAPLDGAMLDGAAFGPGGEILELNDPMPQPTPLPAAAAPMARASIPLADPIPSPPPQPAASEPEIAAEPIVSLGAAAATRGSLDSLSRLMVRPEAPSDGTLEGLIREMLRPMLRDWLDAKLPGMVEAMVAREIQRITGQAG